MSISVTVNPAVTHLGAAEPTGTVTLWVDGASVVTAFLSQQTAVFSLTLAAGSHNVFFVYNGNLIYASSVSDNVPYQVNNKYDVSVVISEISLGKLFATFQNLNGDLAPDGQATLWVDGVPSTIGVLMPVSGSTGLSQAAWLVSGAHNFQVQYPGDATFNAAQSAQVSTHPIIVTGL